MAYPLMGRGKGARDEVTMTRRRGWNRRGAHEPLTKEVGLRVDICV